MEKIFTSLILCTFFLASCSVAPSSIELLDGQRESTLELKEEIPIDFIPKTYKVVSIGDSLTQGVGDSMKRGGYLPYLEEQLESEKGIKDAVFYNFGVSGNRAPQLLNRLYTEELKDVIKDSDMVIITIGGNDVMKVVKENFSNLEIKDFEKDKKQFEKNLRSIIEMIRGLNSDAFICLVGLYNPFYEYFPEIEEMDQIMEDWNNTSQTVLSEYENTFFADISDLFKESEESLLYKDYFHPNDKGYELIGKRVYVVLQEQALDTLFTRNYALNEKEGQ